MPPQMMLDWADDGASNRVLVVTAVAENVKEVKPGDVIVEIAGRPTEDVYQESLGYISAASGQWAQHRFAGDPLWIAPGTGETAAYKVRRGTELLTVNVPRAGGGMNPQPVREDHPANGASSRPASSTTTSTAPTPAPSTH